MALNFQDVIRDVHDPVNHVLQTSSGGATVFAVVNTGAAGIGNSMVTINPRTDYIGLMSISGNVAVSSLPATPSSSNFIGLVTVANTVPVSGTFYQATQPVNFGNVTINPSINSIGFATVSLGAGNSNIGDVDVSSINTGLNYIGLVSVQGNVAVSSIPALVGSNANIGSVSILGGTINTALAASTLNIGSVSILGGKIVNDTSTLNIGSVSVLGGVINTNINTGVTNIGFATVSVSNATLYAVVNTGGAGIQNSMVTINPRTDYFGLVSVSGNVAVSALPATPTGANYIGLASIQGNVVVSSLPALPASASFIGITTAVNASAWPDPKTWIGLATVDIAHSWVDPKTYIGLVTVGHTVTIAAHALTASTVNIGSVSVLGGGIGINSGVNAIGFATITQVSTVTIAPQMFSYYNQSSYASGYVFHGFSTPGANPTTANFRIQRESLNTQEVLFANGSATFINVWSAASLASILYS